MTWRGRTAQTMRGVSSRERTELFGNRGGRRGAGDSDDHQEHALDMLEAQNNEALEQLMSVAGEIRAGAERVRDETKRQNKLLDSLGNAMDKTQSLLGSTLDKMKKMAAQGGSKHMCYMVCFVVFVLIFLYMFAFRARAPQSVVVDDLQAR